MRSSLHRPLALLAAVAGLACFGALASPSIEGRGGPRAGDDRVRLFHGGTFHLGFDASRAEEFDQPTVEAVLVRNGRVVVVGNLAELESGQLGSEAVLINIRGAHAFPGFQDAHGHIESYGASLEEVDLLGCTTYAELVRRVRERASELPAGRWITGRGWDQTLWAGAAFPVHGPLSAAVPDHPVLVVRVDGHAALANEAALKIAGLAAGELPDDPEGGAILRSADRATGVLIDTAMELVRRHVPEPTVETRIRRILRAQDALLAFGLTAVHDMGVDRAATDIFARLRDEGKLKLRVASYVHANDFDSPQDYAGLRRTGGFDEVYKVVGVKFMVDGALGSRGAALVDDYSDAPGNKGLARFDLARLSRQVVMAAEAGLQPATHAIGDRANRLALDAYDRAAQQVDGFAGLRPRIEHAQVVAPNDFARFGELGVLPSMQPTHATSDMRWVVARIGVNRAVGSYAWQTMRASTPLPLAFGSDFPVESPNPLAGIHAVITRQDRDGAPEGGFYPLQRLSAAEAIAGFTSGVAFAIGEEERRGLLAPGCGADMTVVDVDLSTLTVGDAKRALEAKILMTIINGEVVYSSQ